MSVTNNLQQMLVFFFTLFRHNPWGTPHKEGIQLYGLEMNINKITLTSAMMLLIAPATQAQSLLGASVEGQFRSYYNDRDDESYTIEGGADIGIGSNYAIGANLSYGADDDEDVDYVNGTVHAMYMASPTTAVGVFVAQDTSSDLFDSTNYGIEFGGRSNSARYEIFYGQTDIQDASFDDELTIFGASFDVMVGAGFSLGLSIEAFSGFDGFAVDTGEPVDDLATSNISLITRYTIADTASIYAEIGRQSTDAFDDDTTFFVDDDVRFINVGADFTFGGDRGNIFGQRTLVGQLF